MARIVIAEPAPALARLIAHIVRELGHTAATPGVRAHAERCDALILDPGWPQGLLLARRLQGCNPRLPIISIGARRDVDDEHELTITAHLEKPFTLADLEHALRSALSNLDDDHTVETSESGE